MNTQPTNLIPIWNINMSRDRLQHVTIALVPWPHLVIWLRIHTWDRAYDRGEESLSHTSPGLSSSLSLV